MHTRKVFALPLVIALPLKFVPLVLQTVGRTRINGEWIWSYTTVVKKHSSVSVDVSVANPFAGVSNDAYPRPLSHAMQAELKKIAKYKVDCEKIGMGIFPLITDAYEGHSPNIRCRGLSCLASDRLRKYSSVN